MENSTVAYEAVCRPASRTDAVAALEQDFRTQWSQRIAEAVGWAWSGMYLTIGSWRTGPFLGNWLAHAKKLTDTDEFGHVHVVNVALDKGGMDGCENFRKSLPVGRFTLSCVSLVGWLPATLFEAHKDVEAKLGSCESSLALWTKPLILQAAVEASAHPVLMVDTDVIVYKDMLSFGASLTNGGTKQLVTGIEGNGRVNTGTVLATKASLPLLQAWAEQNSKCLNSREVDKSALQHVLHYGKRPESLAAFPLEAVGQCDRKGKFATHYNCAGKNKAIVMRGMHNWADTIPADASDIVLPGQLFNLTPKKAHAAS